MIKINGVAIASPKTFEVTITDLDGETNRNANGDLVRDRIAVKRKISLDWGVLTQNQIQTLLNAVKDVFFTVTYLDPQLGLANKTMYVGDRTSPILIVRNGVPLWENLKMNFIER